MKGQRSLLLKGAGWISAGSVLVNLLGLASLLLLSRLLVPDDFGLVAIAAAFSEIISVITELTLATALIQRRNVEPVHFHTAWTMNVARGFMVAALMVVLSPWIAEFYADARLTQVIQVLALATVINGFTNPKLIMFQRELDFSRTFVMRITNKLSAFLATISVALIYQSYWALVVGTVASAIATTIASYVLIPFRPRIALGAWRDLLSFSVWLTLGTWIQALSWRAQPLLLGYFLPTSLLGQYNVAQRLVGQTVMQATTPIKRLLFPAFSRLQEDSQRLRGSYMRSQGTICLITFPIATSLALLAEDLVILAVGEKWLPAVPIIGFIAVSRMLQVLQNVNALAMATANTKALFFRDLRTFLVRWPLILAGLYLGGDEPFAMLLGAMTGQVVAVVVTSLWNIQLIARISTISIRDHLSLAWRPVVSVAIMAAVVLGAQSLSPPVADLWARAARLAMLAGFGTATYLACLYLIWTLTGRRECVETELASIIRDLASKAISRLRAA